MKVIKTMKKKNNFFVLSFVLLLVFVSSTQSLAAADEIQNIYNTYYLQGRYADALLHLNAIFDRISSKSKGDALRMAKQSK